MDEEEGNKLFSETYNLLKKMKYLLKSIKNAPGYYSQPMLKLGASMKIH